MALFRFVSLFCYLLVLALPFSSAAHFIVGEVTAALDGESSDGKIVTLWNPAIGISDNTTGIIGPNGLSETENTFMIDCELLNAPCSVGDSVVVQVFDGGDGYITDNASTVVTGNGFDAVSNLTMNSPPSFLSITVDDVQASPAGEVDLIAASTRAVTCQGVIADFDGENEIVNVSARFFDNESSSYDGPEDNNDHYTNASCVVDISFGNGNESSFSCLFNVEYYANAGSWNCTSESFDSSFVSTRASNDTLINELLAVEVQSSIDFGEVNGTTVSDEQTVNVSNFGNVHLNLSLEGYARYQGDAQAMNCTLGSTQNISVFYAKYNLTDTNPGALTLSQFETRYVNLTNSSVVRDFGLPYKQDDAGVNVTNSTYWRMYVPPTAAGTCTGNIIFGASIASGV